MPCQNTAAYTDYVIVHGQFQPSIGRYITAATIHIAALTRKRNDLRCEISSHHDEAACAMPRFSFPALDQAGVSKLPHLPFPMEQRAVNGAESSIDSRRGNPGGKIASVVYSILYT